MTVADGVGVAQLTFGKVLSDLPRNVRREEQPVLAGGASLLNEPGGQRIGKVRAGHPDDEPLSTACAAETQVKLRVGAAASTPALDERDLDGGSKRAQSR